MFNPKNPTFLFSLNQGDGSRGFLNPREPSPWFPYHLAYICTKEGNKGRGIATELINEMIVLTKGKLSLHVDLDNRRAKKLYNKLGFKTSYYRMVYSDE
ncbi:MAG: GNAT family N-acetyltransferase [Bacillota bacterium]|nr:GNAT family N-acetyltransferase [Bacillota bacterium]MDD3298469.1 GNAT family N-acetyltransferase [Bacillota bacterium]MDD3851259.1 GNAT family N-acetyltransferase [Bacillota bacterium]MDD4707068.1 GNAT family N-acetyltransferase [Bacillota bacterium]